MVLQEIDGRVRCGEKAWQKQREVTRKVAELWQTGRSPLRPPETHLFRVHLPMHTRTLDGCQPRVEHRLAQPSHRDPATAPYRINSPKLQSVYYPESTPRTSAVYLISRTAILTGGPYLAGGSTSPGCCLHFRALYPHSQRERNHSCQHRRAGASCGRDDSRRRYEQHVRGFPRGVRSLGMQKLDSQPNESRFDSSGWLQCQYC